MTKKLAHMTDDFIIDIEGRSQEDILKEINEAGYSIGHTSLSMLLGGNSFQAGVFEVIEVRFPNKKPEIETVSCIEESPIVQIIKDLPSLDLVQVETPVVMEAVDQKASEPIKPVSVPTRQKVSKVVAGKRPVVLKNSVLPGTKNAKLFEMLTQPTGATKEEMMKECGWNNSCLASILYTVPKYKGYTVFAEKISGNDLRYHLYHVGGAGKVLPEQISYRERKAEQSKIKQKSATVVTSPSSAKVSISKEAMASVPNNIASMAASLSHHFSAK